MRPRSSPARMGGAATRRVKLASAAGAAGLGAMNAWVESMNDQLPDGVQGFTYRQFDYWVRNGWITLETGAEGSGTRRQVNEDEGRALLAMVIRLHEIDQATLEVTTGEFFKRALAGELDESVGSDEPAAHVLNGILDNLRTMRRLKSEAIDARGSHQAYRDTLRGQCQGIDLAISMIKEYL